MPPPRLGWRRTFSEKGLDMPQGEELALGLNKNGFVIFIILLFLCLPLCWIPFVVDSMKSEK